MNNQSEKKSISVAELKEMQAVDIRTVDPATLVDVATVNIDAALPQLEKVQEYLRQIGNPYCYLCNGMVVKISFSGKRKLEDCLKDAMFGKK